MANNNEKMCIFAHIFCVKIVKEIMLEKNQNSNRKRKIIKRISSILLGAVLAFVLLSIVITTLFEDKIAAILLTRMYKYVKVEVTHKDVSFSLIRKFPMASLEVKDIYIMDLQGENVLFTAEKIFLQFNILDLFGDNYTIRRIDVADADLHLIMNEKGQNNWSIFQFDDMKPSENVELNLNRIRLSNVKLLVEHKKQKLVVSTFLHNLSAKGNFSDHIFTTHLSSKIVIQSIAIDTVVYLSNQPIQFHTKLHVDTEKDTYAIEGGNFDLDILEFMANATLAKSNSNYILQTHLSIKHAAIKKIIAQLPLHLHNPIRRLKPEGMLLAQIDIHGMIGNKSNVVIKSDFECRNGSLENIENEVKFSKMNFKGAVSFAIPNPLKTMQFTIRDFSAQLNQGHINGTLAVANLKQPSIELVIDGTFNLADMHRFLPTNFVYKAAGNADVHISFKNQFKQWVKITAADLKNAEIQGNVIFSNANIQIREEETILENLSGELQFDNQLIHTNKLYGKCKDIDFDLNGKIENILPYILDEANRLKITANLYLPDLNLDKLFSKETGVSQKRKNTEQAQELVFPAYLDFDFSFKTDMLTYNHFKAQNTAGRAILTNRVLSLENLQIHTCGGTITAQGTIAQAASSTDFALKCDAKLNGIKMEKLFYAFTDFGQKNLTYKNIQGTANSNVSFRASLRNDITLIANSIVAVIDINIHNGQLNNYSHLEDLSRFVEMNELKSIQFATLENRINIEHSTITIPAMEIKNNALNLSLRGQHTFAGAIDYHISLLCKDVLARKMKNKKKGEDFGEVIDDNTGNMYLYLLATGNVDNPKFKWDVQSAEKGLRQQFSEQKIKIQEIRNRNTTAPAVPVEKKQNNTTKKEIEIEDDW
jgi:hypothetical protein